MLLSTFTVELVDQYGAALSGSAISVPGVGLVANGSQVTTSEGTFSFGVIPKLVNIDPFTDSIPLRRNEIRTVDTSTTSLQFVWPVRQVQINLVDQSGAAITGMNGQSSSFRFVQQANNAQFANGSILALPITDETAFANGEMIGGYRDGYDLTLTPAILDTTPMIHGGGLLSRNEISGTTEISSNTNSLTFVWPVEQVNINLVNQHGVPITGLTGLPSRFAFSNSGLGFMPITTTVALPTTDDAAFPNATLGGIWADGYDLSLSPAILDIDAPTALFRYETHGTTEVPTSNTTLTFEWRVEPAQINLRDQNGQAITGVNGQNSAFRLWASAITYDSGTTISLPITDESVYPELTGRWHGGYEILVAPAILDFSGDPINRLARLEQGVGATTEVASGFNVLNFEWQTVSGHLRVVDGTENEILGSQYRFAPSLQVYATGDVVTLPVTDDVNTGQFANGYLVSIRTDEAPTFSGIENFGLSPDGTFSPAFVTINGSSVGLRFQAENLPPVANAGGPYTVAEGTSLQLNGSGSSDAEDADAALTYAWDLDYNGVTFDSDATGVQPTVSFPDSFAARTIALRVTDSQGLSNIATTTLQVVNADPCSAMLLLQTKVPEFVDSGKLTTAQGHSLIVKIEGAIRQCCDQGNISPTINKLKAFINEVQALVKSRKLSATNGQLLIDLATLIVAQLESSV